MTVAVIALGPELGFGLPDCGVVVQGHGQVIGDQILGADPQVHGIPVPELGSHLVERVGGNVALLGQWSIAENVIEDFFGKIGGIDLARRLVLVAGQIVSALQRIGDGVVGHVDGTVRQAFNDPDRIPREERSKSKHSCAGPFLQPPDGVVVPT